jgi:uncharacterized Zn finger protein
MLVKVGKKYVRPGNIQQINIVDNNLFEVRYITFSGDIEIETVESNDIEHAIKVIINECNQIEQIINN